MATVTEYDTATLADTANQSTYTSNAFTPGSVGELLVVSVCASGTNDVAVLTGSGNGVSTFTLVDRATSNTSSNSTYIYVADQVTTGTASMTVTFDCTGDAATGCIIMVCGLVGMTKTGATAIRQSTKIDNGAAGTPVFTFPGVCLTGNVTIAALGQVSGAGSVEPMGWTEGADTSISTPTWGGTYVYRTSGFTGTTITWGASETAHGGVAVELDASGTAVPPIARVHQYGGYF